MKQTFAFFISTIIVCFGLPAISQETSSKIEETAKSVIIPLDPAIKTGKLANGFTYYIRRNTEPKNRVQLYLVMKVGSILENENQRGLAHFIEHMSFNGTKHYSKNKLVDYLEKAGVRFGADLNATTGFDETVYQLPLPTNNPEVLKNGFQIMRDWAQDATFDLLEIEKERGVIIEEKRGRKGAADRMSQKYLPILLNNSRYSNRLPIGTEEVLQDAKLQSIKEFYNEWYRPDLQALIVVGDVDVNEIEKVIKSKFSDLKNPANAKKRIQYSIPLLNKNQFITVTDKEFPYTVVRIINKYPQTKLRTTADLRMATIRSLYNQMTSERFGELMKQSNPPFIQASNNISGFMAGLDIASTVVLVKPGELEKGVKAALAETEKLKLFGFTQTELDRAKQSYLTSLESSYKEQGKTSSESYVGEYTRLFLQGEASPGINYKFKFAKDSMPCIALSEVNSLAKKYLTETNRDILILASESKADSLPTEAIVNTWISQVKNEKLTAFVDDVSNKPLLANKPIAGKVVSEKTIEAIGVTEITLSNGVKVILKPTDFKNDEILFNSFSPGGTSLYSDADFESASSSQYIVASSGVGDFNSIQLPKLLSGKRLSVSPYISERAEGINGHSSPRDLETTLQLVYLFFTSPRKDDEIFKSLINRSKGMLANRGNDPGAVFADTINAVLGNYSVRRTGPTIAKIDQTKLERAFEIYKERFSDASDFTFTFTGSFKVNEITPLLEQYLGSLPSNGGIESAKDLGIMSPSGTITKTVYKGQENKASVQLFFSGDYDYSPEANHQLQALGSVLKIKLIERLREEESGVYSPDASMNYGKYPKSRYSFTINFICSTENVDKLIVAALDEINKIKEKGAMEGDISKFVAEKTVSTETQLKKNGFWSSYLLAQYQNNEPILQILTYLNALKQITPESLKETAVKYLSGDNLIKFILLPEKK